MKKGIVLFVVLAVLGILAFVGIAYMQHAKWSRQLSLDYLDNIRASLLSYSALNFSLSHILFAVTNDQTMLTQTVGGGTYRDGGDFFKAQILDCSGQININDGVKAGELEITFKRPDDLDQHFMRYYADALDPYPRGNNGARMQTSEWDSIYDPVKAKKIGGGSEVTPEDQEIYEKARSALINLRGRRILNAYGDMHRFIDHSYDDDSNNITLYSILEFSSGTYQLPSPVFSTGVRNSANGGRGMSMSGKKELDLTAYNNGLGDRIIENRPSGGYQRLIEIKNIVNDWADDFGIALTTDYLQGQTFYDLITQDLTVVSFEDSEFFRLDDEMRFGDFDASDQKVGAARGDFKPKDLQLDPPDFTHMWLPHSVPLINMNTASFFVKSAVLYAPTNVSYLCEGATTVPPYTTDSQHDYFDTATAQESAMAMPSIGVAPPVFAEGNEDLEHAIQGAGQSSHIMSLRHAMELSYWFDRWTDGSSNPWKIKSFDDFKIFLHTIRFKGVAGPYPTSISNRRVLNGTIPNGYNGDDGLNFTFGSQFFISKYDDAGEFYNDYLQKTLPHIMSCVRRIPGYLGAPLALQTPYMMLKPNYTGYTNGSLCEQPFRKVEDFVWRFIHPKICFSPQGFYRVCTKGTILNEKGNVASQIKNQIELEVFLTKYFRTQQSFEMMTDRSSGATDADIHIGPHFVNQAVSIEESEYLGFVGLRDFEGDLEWNDEPFKRDHFMTGQTKTDVGGYTPQLVLNFNPQDPNDDLYGLKNVADDAIIIRPQAKDSNDDLWNVALNTDFDKSADSLRNSKMEGSDIPLFGDNKTPDSTCDLSPFGGLRFSSLAHGEFSTLISETAESKFGFNDSFYFRLDDWLTTDPVGQDLSAGVMTFWFQIPSGYDFPTRVQASPTTVLNPTSFSRVLVSLNLWERFEFVDPPPAPPNDNYLRPVTITVGLKKTQTMGYHLFARYDSGGEKYSDSLDDFSFVAPPGVSLTESSITDGLSAQYDFLGYWCASANVLYSEGGILPNYSFYRILAHRSSEVSVSFRNASSCAPGSWHRASVYWDLRWDPSDLIKTMRSDQQLFIDLHDSANKFVEGSLKRKHQWHQEVEYARLPHTLGSPFNYPRDYLPAEHGGNVGFMHNFDSTMVLSFGESHARRLYPYRIVDGTSSYLSQQNYYYPYWRLNSCIDNVRLFMGPSDPADSRSVDDRYFEPTLIALAATQSPYTAMRYKVLSTHELHHPDYTGENIEPTWVIDPELPVGTELISIGSRIYYPPVDYYQEYPYVRFVASNDNDIKDYLQPNVDITDNEQVLFFSGVKTKKDFRLFAQYQAIRPYLDANLKTLGTSDYESIGYPLNYLDKLVYDPVDNVRQFTNIPYIKEVSLRYVPVDGVKILSLEYLGQKIIQKN